MIGIIGAMEIEVATLKKVMENPEVIIHGKKEFYKGRIGNNIVVVVQAGVGKVNAALTTQMLIDFFDVDYIINTGIAGSLDAKIDIGDVVLSTSAIEHDVDAVSFGYELGRVPGLPNKEFTASSSLRKLVREACNLVNPDINVHEGLVLSGDQFIASKEKKQWLISTFGGLCCEMEGGAIAQTCSVNGIEFLIIRMISDKADDSAEMDYPTFEKKAAEDSARLLIEVCKHIK